MRGVDRKEKKEVEKLLSQGVKPVAISRKMNIPLSTITTWNKTVRAKRTKRPAIDAKAFRRERLKLVAKVLNEAEAKITTVISQVINPNITDQKWMEIIKIVSDELKKIAVTTADLH